MVAMHFGIRSTRQRLRFRCKFQPPSCSILSLACVQYKCEQGKDLNACVVLSKVVVLVVVTPGRLHHGTDGGGAKLFFGSLGYTLAGKKK